MTLHVLAEKAVPNTQIAAQLGVTEGTVRYHRRRGRDASDGRARQVRAAAGWADAIERWREAHGLTAADAGVNVADLFEHLVAEHAFTPCYTSLRRYVRERYPAAPRRTYRRVETPPGAQSQSDWGEFREVVLGPELVTLHAFVMVLSHCRMTAVRWSRGKDQLHWLAAHNAAYAALGGVAAVNRIDNERTAIAAGAGPWGRVHPVYRAYAQTLGFHVDACRPRQPHEKGKTEAKVQLARRLADPRGRAFASLAELQAWTDARLAAWAARTRCPATGTPVAEAWAAERPRLRPLPEALPTPFDVVVTRPVQRDCTIAFEGRTYAVPFPFVGRVVEVRGGADTVEVWGEGRRLVTYPRHTAARILLDPACFEGTATATALPPPPLGRLGQRLAAIAAMPVERRPLDLYAALAEVAR